MNNITRTASVSLMRLLTMAAVMAWMRFTVTPEVGLKVGTVLRIVVSTMVTASVVKALKGPVSGSAL